MYVLIIEGVVNLNKTLYNAQAPVSNLEAGFHISLKYP